MGPLYTYSNNQHASTEIDIRCNVDVLNYGWGNFLRSFDYQHDLMKINCPVMIMQGENDWIFDQKHAEHVHHHLKHSTLTIYQHCGHMLWIDQWDKFKRDMLAFIQQ